MKQRDTRKERKVRERKETATKEEKSVREREREKEISVLEAMFAVTDDLILSDMSQAHRAFMRQDRLPLHSPDACQVRPDPAA